MLLRLLKGGVIYGAADVIRKVAPIALLPLYVSHLSLDDFGRQEYVTIIATLFSYVIGWGTSRGLLRLYVAEPHRAVQVALSIVTAIFILIVGAVSISSFFAPIGIFLGLEKTEILFFCITYGWLHSLNNIGVAILRAEERLSDFTIVNLLATLFQVGCISYFLLVLNFGYLAKIIGLIFSEGAVLLFIYFFVLSAKLKKFTVSNGFKGDLAFLTPVSIHNLLGWAYGSLDKVAINVILGAESLGIYSFVLQVCQLFKLGCESLLKSLSVLVYKEELIFDFIKQYRRVILIGIQIAAIIFFFVCAAVSVRWDLGEYSLPFGLFAIVLCSRLVLLANFIEVLKLYRNMDSASVMKSSIVSTVILMVLGVPLIYGFELIGAALALLIAAGTAYCVLSRMQYASLVRAVVDLSLLIGPVLLVAWVSVSYGV